MTTTHPEGITVRYAYYALYMLSMTVYSMNVSGGDVVDAPKHNVKSNISEGSTFLVYQ